MATGTFSFIVLIVFMSLTNLSPTKKNETCARDERRFIDHREKGFVSEDDRVVIVSWLKKCLAGTLVLAGSDADTRRSKRKQCRWKRTGKTGWYLFTLVILMSGDIQI